MQSSSKFSQFLARFKKKEKDVPVDQDALGAYPLRMQISAIPERRYLRTTRVLAVLSFINIGVLIALSGLFIYYAARIDVQIYNPMVPNMYSIDPEHKIINAVEYSRRRVSALELISEKYIRDYIMARNTFYLDPIQQEKYWGPNSVIRHYSSKEDDYKDFVKLANIVQNEATTNRVNKEPYIYSMRRLPTGQWEALVDIFDMPPEDIFNPICGCSNETKECLTCKIQKNKGRRRYKIYVWANLFSGAASLYNPLGLKVYGYYELERIIHPNELYWDLPSILKPEL